jgi:hypothetical protein
MSMIDGTTSELKCGIHDFVTTNLAEWHKHVKEPGHYSVGTGNCAVCGEEYAFTLEDKVPAAMVMRGLIIHPECRGGGAST